MKLPTIKVPKGKLQKDLFNVEQTTGALIMTSKHCGAAMKGLRNHGVLNLPRLPFIIDIPDSIQCSDRASKKLLLLEPELDFTNTLPPRLKDFAIDAGAVLTKYSFSLNYDYFNAEQILRAVLPDELDVPGSFSLIGHIAHFNLRSEYEPYKHIIGQKTGGIRTVVNKTDSIDHTFRFFSMELLAGENDMIANMREGECTFTFDFSKVYWNSRLQTEHKRLTSSFNKGDAICDVFGGVGPFAMPAAKIRECIVYCNDLNPKSYEYLLGNIKGNKLHHRISPFNQDGRLFIEKSLDYLKDDNIWNQLEEGMRLTLRRTDKISVAKPRTRPTHFQHYVMNLPDSATEFLDAFRGLFHNSGVEEKDLPMIHCYCFSRASKEDLDLDVIRRVENILGVLQSPIVHKVRNVAPNKNMMCISFRLPKEAAFSTLKRKAVEASK